MILYSLYQAIYHSTKKSHFSIHETYWGYIVQPNGGPRLSIRIQQYVATFIGACFFAAALSIILVPQMAVGAIDYTMRGGAAVMLAGVAAFCLWFATRGSTSELQVDTNLGEVREVIRNRAGASTLLGSYGFDAIGGVYIDRTKGAASELVLRYRNTSQTLHVATGHPLKLENLRDRLGQDLMLRTEPETATEFSATSALLAAE